MTKLTFDFLTERSALEKLDIDQRPRVMQGDYYLFEKSGLVLVELFSIKPCGRYRVFPTFIVIRQGTKGDYWHNQREVGTPLITGMGDSYKGVYKSFKKLSKHEHSTRFKPLIDEHLKPYLKRL